MPDVTDDPLAPPPVGPVAPPDADTPDVPAPGGRRSLTEALTSLELSDGSVLTLEQTAASLRERRWPGTLTVVSAPDADTAAHASLAVCRTAAHGNFAHLDIHEARPESDRWKVAELDELVIRPCTLRPFERTHVTVVDADRMAPAAWDRLLKTLEEPPGGSHFWFAVKDPDRLPTTIRGRASHTIELKHNNNATRVAHLATAGIPVEEAREIVTLAGQQPLLGAAVASDVDTLLPALRVLAHAQPAIRTPTATADTIVAAALTLGVALAAAAEPATSPGSQPATRRRPPSRRRPTGAGSQFAARPRWDSVPPPARSRARRQVALLLERWAEQVPTAVAAADSPDQLRAAASTGRAVERAMEEMATNAPASTVLAGLLSRAGH